MIPIEKGSPARGIVGLLLALPLLWSVGCADREEMARVRAAHELRCPTDEVGVAPRPDISDGTFDVEACGQRARYTCFARRARGLGCAREPLE